MPDSDETLLNRAVLGDRPALTELLRRHGKAVKRHLAGKIDPRWQSVLSEDDVLQETFADAFLSIRNFKSNGVAGFVSWLNTLARNNLLDAVKALKTRRRGGDHQRTPAAPPVNADESYMDLFQQLDASVDSPSVQVAIEEVRAAMDGALEKLPESYRLVVSLYDLAGCSIDDVAEACDCTPGAVYMRRRRAHAMLREILGGSWPFIT